MIFMELMAAQAANPVSDAQIAETRKIERAAIRTAKKSEQSIKTVPALVLSAEDRQAVMGMQSVPCLAGAYSDDRMASFPVGTWGMSLVSYFGQPAICRKVKFQPFHVSTVNVENGDAVITLAPQPVTAWLFEDGTWLSDKEASTLITVLRG